MENEKAIYQKLLAIQGELKIPKTQFNDYGKYKYRSCEDILEAVKPLLQKYSCLVILTDELLLIGERYYIKATATFLDTETGKSTHVTALAREPNIQKGMSESQITGAASSYARKYALNGLFAIDDTKDADFLNKGEEKKTTKAEPKKESTSKCSECSAPITNKVAQFSKKVYKKELCFACQKIHQSNAKKNEQNNKTV